MNEKTHHLRPLPAPRIDTVQPTDHDKKARLIAAGGILGVSLPTGLHCFYGVVSGVRILAGVSHIQNDLRSGHCLCTSPAYSPGQVHAVARHGSGNTRISVARRGSTYSGSLKRYYP